MWFGFFSGGGMKKLLLVLIVILLSANVTIYAADSEMESGKVLYHQDFSDISDIVNSGVRVGTLSDADAYIDCFGDSMRISTYNSGRLYLILPQIQKPSTYTVEFSFKFIGSNSNAYLAYMLTCRGTEPGNISSVVFRANGMIDDFEAPAPELSDAISRGETVNVTIPIENNVLYQMKISCDGEEYVLNRDSVLVISNEKYGFSARNSSVDIYDVYLVSGIDYEEKFGYYAKSSFATDANPIIPEDDGYLSPNTYDSLVVIVVLLVVSLAAIVTLLIINSRRRR